MSKLSGSLKALVNAEFAHPGPASPSKHIRPLLEELIEEAKSKNVGLPAWIAITTATTFTMNAPDALTEIFKIGSRPEEGQNAVQVAELMREVGLKCIGFNGIPRTINCLGAFRANLPEDVTKQMTTKARRLPTPDNVEDIRARGIALWKSIYDPFAEKLTNKLAQSHPDLPVHIHNSHYGPLFSDPPETAADHGRPNVGRVLTSLVAISCLRAQTGVGPQVISHLFGLRKAYDNKDQHFKEDVKGGEFLATDEGNQWILHQVDSLVGELSRGTTFAPGFRAKL